MYRYKFKNDGLHVVRVFDSFDAAIEAAGNDLESSNSLPFNITNLDTGDVYELLDIVEEWRNLPLRQLSALATIHDEEIKLLAVDYEENLSRILEGYAKSVATLCQEYRRRMGEN